MTDNSAALAIARHHVETGRFDLAQPILRRHLRTCDDLDVLRLYADVSLKAGDFRAATTAFASIIERQPGDVEGRRGLGQSLFNDGNVDAAIEVLDGLVAEQPSDLLSTNFLIEALAVSGRLDDAIRMSTEVVDANQGDPLARFRLGKMLLMAGRFDRGWCQFEARRDLEPDASIKGVPIWDGRELADERIAVVADYPLPETVFFSRFIGALVRRGGRPVVCASAEVQKIFSMIEGVAETVGPGGQMQELSWQVPLASLPNLLGGIGPSQENTAAYLNVDSDRVDAIRAAMGGDGAKVVGLVWRGFGRDCALSKFKDLVAIPGIHLVPAQPFVGQEDVLAEEWLGSVPTIEGDLVRRAEVLKALDLLIAVDGVEAQMAAAMHVPTWVMTGSTEWWWAGADQALWYPTAKVFRSKQAGRFTQMIPVIADALRAGF